MRTNYLTIPSRLKSLTSFDFSLIKAQPMEKIRVHCFFKKATSV